MDWTQKRRDNHLQQSLESLFPATIVELTRSYAMEVALLPLQFDNYGSVLKNSTNEPILARIQEFFLSGDPEDELHQIEIIKNHQDLLETVFSLEVNKPEHVALLVKAAANPEAMKLLRNKIAIVTNFVSYAKCENLLRDELLQFDPDSTRLPVRTSTTARLLLEAMRKIDPAARRHRTAEALQMSEAAILMGEARIHKKNNNMTQCYESLLGALHLYCELREKKRVSNILVQLIKASQTEKPSDLTGFYDLARKLCLVYPMDSCAYADLLLAMHAICNKHGDLSLTRKLFRTALTDGIRPPVNYNAKIIYLHLKAEREAGLAMSMLVPNITSFLKLLGKQFQQTDLRKLPVVKIATDLSADLFFINTSRLYQMLGSLGASQIGEITKMSSQQQQECATLFTPGLTAEQLMGQPVSDVPGLRRSTVANLMTSNPKLPAVTARMVHSVAENCKDALKMLLEVGNYGNHRDEAEKELLAVFETLVRLYHDARLTRELEQLLATRHHTSLARITGFHASLPQWREMLLVLKESHKKLEESVTGE